jgi:2-dehydro-3-deoxyphosphooctonate aldolase (KDO 8-P synthase)
MNITIATPTNNRSILIGGGELFPIIAGPCVVESEKLLHTVAEELVRLASVYPAAFIFKASYRKANRTSGGSFTGLGDTKALELLQRIRQTYDLPVLTDIHLPDEAAMAAEVCDILQIPAFLSRQTDILEAAARTQKVVNIKKGQFMSAQDMKFARGKVLSAGNDKVLLTERGTMFGYGDLIVDYRNLVAMAAYGSPVIFDATHSVQKPSQNGMSGGAREYIAPLTRAAMAVGIDGLFIETHPDPANALSDAASQLPLKQLSSLLDEVFTIRSTRE